MIMSHFMAILYTLVICFLAVRAEIEERYQRLPGSQQYGSNAYEFNAPSANPVGNDGLVDEFGQCGGIEYEGTTACRSKFVCVKRSKYYSQCLTPEGAAVATRPSPQKLTPGAKCHGGGVRGPVACETGSACFIQTENIHGECKSYCPPGWFCAKQTLPEWAPCGGEGYVGLTKCKEGLQCIPHSKWYHECRSDCPAGWTC